MKKIYTILALLLFSSILSAQTINLDLIEIANFEKTNFFPSSERSVSNDTIMDYIERAGGLYITGLQDSGVFVGYASGTNPIYSELGMRMTRTLSPSESMKLLAGIYIVYKKVGLGSTDNFTFKAYDINTATNMPTGSALASETISIDAVDTTSATGGVNVVTFSSTPSINSEFAISMDLTGVDDTIALYTSNPGTNDGAGENRFYFNYGGQYISANVGFSNQMDADLLMGAIVEVTDNGSGGAGVTEKELAVNTKIFPNPTSGDFQLISYVTDQNIYKVEVFDLAGKKATQTTFKTNGILNERIDMTDLKSGSYFIKITSGQHTYTDKIIIK